MGSLSQTSPEVCLLGNCRSCHADSINLPSTLGQVSRRESLEINGEELGETRRAAVPSNEPVSRNLLFISSEISQEPKVKLWSDTWVWIETQGATERDLMKIREQRRQQE